MPALREKSLKLTGYLIYLIEKLNEKGGNFNIITPKTPEDRGAQLSILTGDDGKALFDYLTENGVITDWREPNVIRLAPVPMYNNFEDVWWFAEFLNRWLDK
jgi:kynureninase